MENVKYKISKKNNSINGSLKLHKGIPFVGCGFETGELLGFSYKIYPSINSFSEDLAITPFILFCENISQANAMYENLKKDKTRFNKLAAEIQKQKLMDKSKQQVNIETQNLTNSNLSNSKRLSLNNGIFKSNDNY
jgi:hypothetical protein